MKSLNPSVSNNLKLFAKKYVERYVDKYQHLPLVECDENWPSECIQGNNDAQTNLWQPIEVQEKLSFDNIETALDINLHDDIRAYFTTLYSDSLHAACSEGELSLLLPWSQKDFERLQENIIGHVLMKKKLKQPVTVFFAVTDDEDCILSVNNQTGEVWVERVGCEPHKKLADSIAEFIEQLQPAIP
ncbi:SecY-interacting protein [Thalassotalea fusca]